MTTKTTTHTTPGQTPPAPTPLPLRLGLALGLLSAASLAANLTGCSDDGSGTTSSDSGSETDDETTSATMGESGTSTTSSTSGTSATSATTRTTGVETSTEDTTTSTTTDSGDEDSMDCERPGEVKCSGFCTDLASDKWNCGVCGKRCDDDELCRDRLCVPELQCDQGEDICDSTCVDTQVDDDHCGACNNACDTKVGEICRGGNCGCREGQTVCDNFCVDTQVDGDHCGTCNNACDGGRKCSQGMCTLSCGTDETECGNSCVNTDEDNNHCGACDKKCDAGDICKAGACIPDCAVGQTICDDTCVDTDTDEDHCGACGTKCDSDEVCEAGSCKDTCEADEVFCDNKCIDPKTDKNFCGASGDCLGNNNGDVCTANQECLAGSCENNPSWGNEQRIDSGTTDATQGAIVADGSDDAMAVWVQNKDSEPHLWSNRYNHSTGVWANEAVSVLGDKTPHEIKYVSLATDTIGRAFVVWQNKETAMSGSEIHVMRSEAKFGAWGSFKHVSDFSRRGTVNYTEPSLAVDRNGNAMVVFVVNNPDKDIYASHFKASTSTWSTPVRLEQHTGDGSVPRVTVDRNGTFTAVWLHEIAARRGGGSGSYDLRSNRYESGRWSNDSKLVEDLATSSGNNFEVGADDDGNVHVVWQHTESTSPDEYRVRTSRLLKGRSDWTDPEHIDQASLRGQPSRVTLAVSPDGSAFALWVQGSDALGYDIRANRYNPDSKSWLAGNNWLIDNALTAPASDPHVVVDGNGRAMAAWKQGNGGQEKLYTAQYNPDDSTWSTPTDRADAEVGKPELAIGHDDDAVFMLWPQEIDGNEPFTMFARRYGR